MSRIILIETSTSLCSTAVAVDGRIVASRESTEPRVHAAMTAVFVKEMLDECGMTVRDCDAVAVSSGPGSYTGLRVGSSTAKGFCFGAGKPLIAVCTLDILVRQAVEEGLVPEGCRCIRPMLDARRMEVYTAPFTPDPTGEFVRSADIAPVVVDADTFAAELAAGPVLFIGDGAAKCASVVDSANAGFVQTNPHAAAMAFLAQKAFDRGDFQDTAYFEPFYLKDFVATVSRKKLF